MDIGHGTVSRRALRTGLALWTGNTLLTLRTGNTLRTLFARFTLNTLRALLALWTLGTDYINSHSHRIEHLRIRHIGLVVYPAPFVQHARSGSTRLALLTLNTLRTLLALWTLGARFALDTLRTLLALWTLGTDYINSHSHRIEHLRIRHIGLVVYPAPFVQHARSGSTRLALLTLNTLRTLLALWTLGARFALDTLRTLLALWTLGTDYINSHSHRIEHLRIRHIGLVVYPAPFVQHARSGSTRLALLTLNTLWTLFTLRTRNTLRTLLTRRALRTRFTLDTLRALLALWSRLRIAGVGGIECVRYGHHLLHALNRIVRAAVGVDFCLQEIETRTPIDSRESAAQHRAFADDERHKAVDIRGCLVYFLIDEGAVRVALLHTLKDAHPDPYRGIGQQLVHAVAHDRLVTDFLWRCILG